jgi:ferredoxin-NADP reductase
MSTKTAPTIHSVKLEDRREIAERTIAVWLEKPADFVFSAGQFAEVFLTVSAGDSADEQALAFSMASAPEDERLMFATRLRGGAFKQALATMPVGREIKIEGPYGKFVLHDDASKPAIFLAFGIGITPVRSILLNAARAQLQHKIFLFYSNRRPEDAGFLEELQALESANHNYRFIGTMTQMDKSQRPWLGETGHLDYAMISKHVKEPANAMFYVVGPPAAVKATRQMLGNAGIKKDDIRSEDFVGY